MLDSFRSLANSWFAKLLLLVLIMAFAVWGIGDMLRSGGRNPTVATVGSADIKASEFERSFRIETENIRHLLGDNDSPELLKSLNIPQRVMQKLINSTLIRLESQSLGLIPDDKSVVERIRANPEFQDENGTFDKKMFEEYLQHANISENNYVEKLRQDMATGLLTETLTGAVVVPDIAAKTLLADRNEQRAATFYTLNTSLVGSVPAPGADQVKAYYKEHGANFTAPEYRTLSYVTLSALNTKSEDKASDDELRSLYKERIDDFKHPERRTLDQVLYDNEDKAKKAEALLKSGKKLEQVEKEIVPMNPGALRIGKVARNEVPDTAVDAVFALSAGGFTEPMKNPFGWTIYHVAEINPPSTDSFEEARPKLAKEVLQRDQEDALTQLSNKLQDALAGGSTLQEAAKDLQLTVHTLGPVDHQGRAPDGSAVKDIPPLVKFLDTAFKTDEKSESALTASKDGVFYIVRVESITPEHLHPLEDVKAQVVAGWQKQERQKRLGDMAKDIAVKFNGATRDSIIRQYHLKPAATEPVKRSSQTAGSLAMPPQMVSALFALKPGESTGAYPMQKGDYIFAVTGAAIPAPSPDKDPKLQAELANIRKTIGIDMQNEIMLQYTRSLADKYPVSINQSALQSLFQ